MLAIHNYTELIPVTNNAKTRSKIAFLFIQYYVTYIAPSLLTVMALWVLNFIIYVEASLLVNSIIMFSVCLLDCDQDCINICSFHLNSKSMESGIINYPCSPSFTNATHKICDNWPNNLRQSSNEWKTHNDEPRLIARGHSRD